MSYSAAIIDLVLKEWRGLPILDGQEPPSRMVVAECEEVDPQVTVVDTPLVRAWLRKHRATSPSLSRR